MIFPCKVWPIEEELKRAFPKEPYHWAALLPMKLMYRHASTKSFEAWVDSGAPYCMFDAALCKPLGIKLTTGIKATLKGVIKDAPKTDTSVPIYLHPVTIVIGGEQFGTMAGFSEGIAVGAILGRRGFFENFKVSFDAEPKPPQLELTKIHRT